MFAKRTKNGKRRKKGINVAGEIAERDWFGQVVGVVFYFFWVFNCLMVCQENKEWKEKKRKINIAGEIAERDWFGQVVGVVFYFYGYLVV